MSSNNVAEREQGRSLVNRPEMKLASLPKRAKIIKRPLPSPRVFRQAARNSSASNAPTADIDGYQIPPRAAHTVIIKVASKTPLMAIINRKTKGLPLTARIAAIDALDDVVLIATGKAIQRAFKAAFLLRRNKELVVIFRTRTVSSINDIVMDDDEADEEDQVQVRHVSCVEIGVRWK
ncbi:hypothetical protein B0T16DRAFT_432592 [Cercophora newfieldiana]|uniref:Uncharacterized protein n=1 Tax=Cercophora newfieldiana TaxID=92897 RepID=A0AA39YM43_9PEZI|nr:hypothetical protein B0T16DRAFT_432592 [Cercophora newfieldiana]